MKNTRPRSDFQLRARASAPPAATLIALVALASCDVPGEEIQETRSALLEASKRVNCGSTSASGTYAADSGFTGGFTQNRANTIDVSGVLTPAPQAVYQTARLGNFTYAVTGLAKGTNHRVRLHFAETYWGAANSRTFNVSINGLSLLLNFDIYASAGAKNRAVMREFIIATDSAGTYTMQFATIKDNAEISGIEILPAAPCWDGTSGQTFTDDLFGCPGSVSYANRANLCGAGYHVASAEEWAQFRGSSTPAHNYWTDDNLRWDGAGSGSCSANNLSPTGNTCAGEPMRVCTPTGSDPEGNACNWTNCGLDSTGPNMFLGGCSGNSTAGTLCVKSLCAKGDATEIFSDGMVGCSGAETFANKAALCAPGYRVAGSREWSRWKNPFAPQHDYWTADVLRYSGAPGLCSVTTDPNDTNFSDCPAGQPMRVCTLTGNDSENNACNWNQCGGNVAGNLTSDYFGGCAGNATAGAVCIHAAPLACLCDTSLCGKDTQTCGRPLWALDGNGTTSTIWYEIRDSWLRTSAVAGMNKWMTATNNRVKFVEDTTKAHADRLVVQCLTKKDGACVLEGGNGGVSQIGYSSAAGGNYALLASATDAGFASHELGHIIGFSHEHIRGDRDRYLRYAPNSLSCDANTFNNNYWKCGINDTASDFGVFNTSSIMGYGGLPLQLPKTGTNVGVGMPGVTGPGPREASAVLEMYAPQLKGAGGTFWKKFISLGVERGGHAPLDPAIPAPPAGAANVLPLGRPAIASRDGVGTIDYFVRGTDKHMYHRARTSGAWGAYEDLNSPTWDTDPAAVSWSATNVIVIAGKSGRLYWSQQNSGTWGNWIALPTFATAMATGASPAVTSWSNGTLLVAVRNVNNGLNYLVYANGNWPAAWLTVNQSALSGVTLAGDPALASQTTNGADLFVTATDGTIRIAHYNNGWTGTWTSLSGIDPATSPTATSWGNGHLDVVFKNTAGTLNWMFSDANSAWKGPFPIGGRLQSSPAASTKYGSKRIELMGVVVDDGALWGRFLN